MCVSVLGGMEIIPGTSGMGDISQESQQGKNLHTFLYFSVAVMITNKYTISLYRIFFYSMCSILWLRINYCRYLFHKFRRNCASSKHNTRQKRKYILQRTNGPTRKVRKQCVTGDAHCS